MSRKLEKVVANLEYFVTSVMPKAGSANHLDHKNLSEMFGWAKYCKASVLNPKLGPSLAAQEELAEAPKLLYLAILNNHKLNRHSVREARKIYESCENGGQTDPEARLCLRSRNDLKSAVCESTYLFPERANYKDFCKTVLYPPNDKMHLRDTVVLFSLSSGEYRADLVSFCLEKDSKDLLSEIESLSESELSDFGAMLQESRTLRRHLVSILPKPLAFTSAIESLILSSRSLYEEIKSIRP